MFKLNYTFVHYLWKVFDESKSECNAIASEITRGKDDDECSRLERKARDLCKFIIRLVDSSSFNNVAK